MCDPTSILIGAVALGAGSTALGIKSQNDAASAQAQSANQAASNDYDLLNLQEKQVNDASATEAFNRERQGMREMAKIRTSQGESGAMGNSSLRELHSSMFNTSLDTSIIESNREDAILQAEANKTKIGTTNSSRLNEAKASGSNPLMSFMKIGSAGMSGYATGASINKSLK
jgi:hypothetical protein